MSLSKQVLTATVADAPDNLPSIPATRLVGHEEGPIRAVKFSNDGKYCISAGHDRTVRLFNPTRVDPAYAPKNQSRCSSYVYSHQNVAASGGFDLDSIPHALPIQVYSDGYTHPPSAIDMDDSSTTLISASDKTLIATDVLTRKLKRRFQGHTGRINSVACASGGSVLLSASYDGTVRIWDGRSFNSNPVQILSDATDSVSCVKVLEDRKSGNDLCGIVTSSIDGCVRSYDLRRGIVQADDFNNGGTAITSFSCTSDFMCYAASCLNGSVHVMERSTGTLLNTCFGKHTSGRYSLECHITSDDQYIASGSEDGSVVFYDFASGKVGQILKGHMRPTCSLACHPNRNNSSVFISSSYDGSAIVWTNKNAIIS